MITEDDARMTLELADRYVICPPRANYSPAPLLAAGAVPVAEGFRYSSETNSEWLEKSALATMASAKRK
jgi:UDP-N-acetylglucosamine 4,6-dehydratase